MSANGSRDTANRYFIDGIEFMDYDAMTYSFSPSVDSLAEFKVETSTYSAESGGAPGGQVNMLTKRGGNQYHGTLWEFNRNDALTQSYDAIAGKSVDAAAPEPQPVRRQRRRTGTASEAVQRARTRRSSSSTGSPAGWRRAPCQRFRIVPPEPHAHGRFPWRWSTRARGSPSRCGTR